jgi:hypothetical protein
LLRQLENVEKQDCKVRVKVVQDWKNETFSSLSKMTLLAQGQGNIGEMVQTGLATSLLRNGLRVPCVLCSVVYWCI